MVAEGILVTADITGPVTPVFHPGGIAALVTWHRHALAGVGTGVALVVSLSGPELP